MVSKVGHWRKYLIVVFVTDIYLLRTSPLLLLSTPCVHWYFLTISEDFHAYFIKLRYILKKVVLRNIHMN